MQLEEEENHVTRLLRDWLAQCASCHARYTAGVSRVQSLHLLSLFLPAGTMPNETKDIALWTRAVENIQGLSRGHLPLPSRLPGAIAFLQATGQETLAAQVIYIQFSLSFLSFISCHAYQPHNSSWLHRGMISRPSKPKEEQP